MAMERTDVSPLSSPAVAVLRQSRITTFWPYLLADGVAAAAPGARQGRQRRPPRRRAVGVVARRAARLGRQAEEGEEEGEEEARASARGAGKKTT